MLVDGIEGMQASSALDRVEPIVHTQLPLPTQIPCNPHDAWSHSIPNYIIKIIKAGRLYTLEIKLK